jgi:hypothetical protein
MRCLVLLLPAVLALGPSCKDNTWTFVFWRAVGTLYSDSQCTTATTPAASCPFPSIPEVWGSVGPESVAVGVKCLSASTFSLIAGVNGDTSEMGPFSTGDCASLSLLPPPFAWGVQMDCRPGLLIFLISGVSALVLLACCFCCCRCCCRSGSSPKAAVAMPSIALVASPQQQQLQQQPVGFYGQQQAYGQGGFYAPPQGGQGVYAQGGYAPTQGGYLPPQPQIGFALGSGAAPGGAPPAYLAQFREDGSGSAPTKSLGIN